MEIMALYSRSLVGIRDLSGHRPLKDVPPQEMVDILEDVVYTVDIVEEALKLIEDGDVEALKGARTKTFERRLVELTPFLFEAREEMSRRRNVGVLQEGKAACSETLDRICEILGQDMQHLEALSVA